MGRTLVLTSPLEKGNDVAAFQRALTKNGYYHGEINSEYDTLTAQSAFRAKYWEGYLHPDHVAGDRLYGYLMGAKRTPAMVLIAKRRRAAVKPPQATLAAKALANSFKDVGIKETPVNNNYFGKWYGFNYVPWCNEAVSKWYCDAGSKSFKRGERYSFVPAMDMDARTGRNHLSISHPVIPGDVVTFDWDHDGTPDHTGLFVKWIDKAAGTFESVEGNTSGTNNSNGGEVMHRKDRVISEVRTFIHVGA